VCLGYRILPNGHLWKRSTPMRPPGALGRPSEQAERRRLAEFTREHRDALLDAWQQGVTTIRTGQMRRAFRPMSPTTSWSSSTTRSARQVCGDDEPVSWRLCAFRRSLGLHTRRGRQGPAGAEDVVLGRPVPTETTAGQPRRGSVSACREAVDETLLRSSPAARVAVPPAPAAGRGTRHFLKATQDASGPLGT